MLSKFLCPSGTSGKWRLPSCCCCSQLCRLHWFVSMREKESEKAVHRPPPGAVVHLRGWTTVFKNSSSNIVICSWAGKYYASPTKLKSRQNCSSLCRPIEQIGKKTKQFSPFRHKKNTRSYLTSPRRCAAELPSALLSRSDLGWQLRDNVSNNSRFQVSAAAEQMKKNNNHSHLAVLSLGGVGMIKTAKNYWKKLVCCLKHA